MMTTKHLTYTNSWDFTPEAKEEMRKHDELMNSTGFEGVLLREQMAVVWEETNAFFIKRVMERICPRMPLMMAS